MYFHVFKKRKKFKFKKYIPDFRIYTVYKVEEKNVLIKRIN